MSAARFFSPPSGKGLFDPSRLVYADFAMNTTSRMLRVFAVVQLFAAAAGLAPAATYYVAPDGNDAAPGSSSQPWRTIQKAANTALAGDSVIVLEGAYGERITTIRGGTSDAARIIFQAEGQVTMNGWRIDHPYVSVRGFDIVGGTEGYVLVSSGGDSFELLSCRVRDGVGLWHTNMVFTAPNQISSVSGGFLAAGFAPGQSISVSRATNIALLNTGNYVLDAVTDTTLTVTSSDIVDDGPKPAYLSAANAYALSLATGSERCVIRSNVFSNLSYDYWIIQGMDHLLEGNTLEKNNGWDLIFFSGTNHVFRGNWFRNNGWGTYQPSADIFDNRPVRYDNIHFTNNYVESFIGVINAQKYNSTVSGPFYVTRNVFVDVGRLTQRMPNTTVENNTFLRVARNANVAVAVARHPLYFDTSDYATNAVIRNNIFVDCGQASGPVPVGQVGWYEISGPADTVVAEGNFVAGAAPAYAGKTGWPEGNSELNGGDPLFVNLNDPLGPDGLPFTEDDGLRLLPGSKLIGAGVGGATIGAYAAGDTPPTLAISHPAGGPVRVAWPEEAPAWTLQGAPTVFGTWTNVPGLGPPVDGWFEFNFQPTEAGAFFRLVR
jgi:hypothetical protein